MKCPACAREFTKGQELLYKTKDVYYCPYCWSRISAWPGAVKAVGQAPVEKKPLRKAA